MKMKCNALIASVLVGIFLFLIGSVIWISSDNEAYFGSSRILIVFNKFRANTNDVNATTTLMPSSSSGFKLKANCGLWNGRSKRIVNGQDTNASNWPWLVSLKYVNNSQIGDHFCSGSLVDERHIVTSAHCLASLNRSQFAVVFEANVTIGVESIYLNEQFNKKSPTNDIALIRLEKSVPDDNGKISLACLPGSSSQVNFVIGKVGLVAGWGKQQSLSDQPRKLKQTALRVLDNGTFCSRYLEGYNLSTLYCAYDTNQNGYSNVCLGDSGSPLMFYFNDRFYLYGVVSFVLTVFENVDQNARVKCLTRAPSYFTKVPLYIDWLYSKMSQI